MRESPAGLSMLKLYMACPRQWAFKYVLGWKPVGEDSAKALVLGSAIHDCREHYLVTGKDRSKIIEQSIITSGHDRSQEIALTFRRMWDAWVKFWSVELANWELLAIERPYTFRLSNGFPITLRVDAIIQNRESQYIYIIDTKTTGWSISGMEKSYQYDFQPIVYHKAIYENHPEWIPLFKGWLTDIIYQKGNQPAQTHLSDPVYYTEQEVNDYLQNLSSITSDIKFSMGETHRDKGDFSLYFAAHRGPACTAYNSECKYRKICLRPPTAPCEPDTNFELDTPEFTLSVHKAFEEIK